MNLLKEQQQAVLDLWNKTPENPPPLLEIIKHVFPDLNVDGRSKEGRAVKAFLSSKDLRARGAHEYQPKDKIELTEEQEEFIRNNVGMMNGQEIAKVIFKNPDITNLHQEARTVNDFINSLGNNIARFESTPSEEINGPFKAPTTTNLTLNRIIKYVPGVDRNKLTLLQKKGVDALWRYLNTYRFSHQMDAYRGRQDRKLFESSFIRYTHDKPDLSQEEVDQFIVLSVEVVIAANIQRRVEHLQNLLDDNANDSEGRRIAMALVEAISTAQTEYNQCINRQTKLLDNLKEKRSDKLRAQIRDNASVLNLVQLWKEEESRKKLIKMAQLRKQDVRKEVENLSSMDEVKAKIMGLTEDEI